MSCDGRVSIRREGNDEDAEDEMVCAISVRV